MKKAAILTIASFYLLLTTGMFVCMVHCAGEYFFTPAMAMQSMSHSAHHHSHHQHHGKSKDCDCCNKHGNYVIKENIKPAAVDVQAPQIALLPQQFNYIPVAVQYPSPEAFPLSYGKAPPGQSGKAISIQLRSLQI